MRTSASCSATSSEDAAVETRRCFSTERVHTVVLGAGPAGLAAGYILAKAGRKPVVVEKGKQAGGLMQSIKHGDFILDIGRKELYNRLARVDGFWSELLGDDYRQYPHRGGILFDGNIIEMSPAVRGFRRGMPWRMFLGCARDLAWWRIRSRRVRPSNLEEYFYQKRGRRLTQIISQGFQEKLSGTKWAAVPMPAHFSDSPDATFFRTVSALLARTFARMEANTFRGVWRHPVKGTGQICDALEQGIVKNGGRVVLGADVLDMESANGAVNSVTVRADGETVVYEAEHIVSSIPAQVLLKLLLKDRFDSLDSNLKAPPSSKRTIVLVYLFLDEEPRFPHAWLNVTCSKTKIGRITNYRGINGGMVPGGKTCLCCEFFCHADDEALQMDDRAFSELALADLARHALVDPAKCFDHRVLRLRGADASQNRHNWMNNLRTGLLTELEAFRNLYYASRTDLDIATLAGIEAAEAILSGDRTTFDHHVDPANLAIRSAKKAFEFRNPAT
jgi:protoporphyrinogen oxidase